MDKTTISWTTRTMNFWVGCTRVSPGCVRCYMFTAQERFGRDPRQVVRTKTWGDPPRWEKAAAKAGRTERVFTCSWSDFFHEGADAWRDEAWAVIRATPHLHYQVLTKRPERIAAHLPADWGGGYPNAWLGVSVEDRKRLGRIDVLRDIPASVRFLSVEPLLEDLGPIDLRGIDWVIVGGESGPGWRPMDTAWARSIRDQCNKSGIAYYFKQNAGPKPEADPYLDGVTHHEYPTPRRPDAGPDHADAFALRG